MKWREMCFGAETHRWITQWTQTACVFTIRQMECREDAADGSFAIALKRLIHFQVFMAKVLNHVMPSLTLGSIESKWVSRDKKQVRERETSSRA